MDSPQIIVNRKTEKVVDKQRSVSEKIEQTERTYYPGSNVPNTTEHFILKNDQQQPSSQTLITNSSPSKANTMSTSNDSSNANDVGDKNNSENGAQATVTVSSSNGDSIPDNAQLISRTTQQVKTQQVKTVTKVFTTREIRHIGPDGQPIEPPTSNTNSDYTNFPGPRFNHEELNRQEDIPNGSQSQPQHSQSNFDYQQQFDPHYSNTNFNLLHARQQGLSANMAPSQSPGSGSTVTTGSTAVASFVNPQMATNVPRIYDPYSRNNQVGYQDYSNFNNYQDLAHMSDMGSGVGGQGASPQPPIRRHHPGELPVGAGGEPTYVQTSHGPVAYGYIQGQPNAPGSGLVVSTSTLPMHSPNPAASAAIYGNFEEAPQGYLDRRQTYDDHATYGQMRAPQLNPTMPPPSMYDEAESAYQHLQALQAAGVMDPQQAAMFFQNGLIPQARMTHQPMGGNPPGSAAITAIGPDGVRWRDPDLHEVIEFLAHPNNIVRANAAAYLQHLCFMDDSMKAKTRALGGIPALINLLSQDVPEIQRNSCGALRNLSYGRQNDENKRAIRNACGIPALVRLLRKTPDNEIREMVTSVLWNLSSCEELKRQIIDDALSVLVTSVIIPHSGWDRQNQQQQSQNQPPIYWSTLFRNASGVLRNVSSAGEYARKRLRECDGLVDSLLFLVRAAIGKNDMDNKSVENCVCILRNLSYRCQEVVDPEYDKHPPGITSPIANSTNSSSNTASNTSSSYLGQSPSSTLSPSSSSSSKNSTSSLMGGLSSKVGENLSCFGGSKKKSKHHSGHQHDSSMNILSPSASVSALEAKTANLTLNSNGQRSEVPTGMELLWQTEVVQPYLALLSECSNPETLEAAAGAIQNLAACYWQPSIDIRGAVRKEKGLPILVELLRMEVDRVVCAVATALRNLAMDTRNKELIGKYALKDLVSKLPTPSSSGTPLETGTSDDTVAAVLATLNEVIARNPDFAKSLLEASGMQRLTLITKHRNRFSVRVVKFTSQLLYNMWQHTELREVYRKAGWKESHFIVQLSGNNTNARSGRVNGSGMMTPSASAMLMTPSTPTANGTLPGSGLYHSISANNTLSRPMSTVGGTKYEDHQHFRTLPRPQPQQQRIQARMPEELLMSEMVDGSPITNGGTLIRPPIGGVPIFPPGTMPGEPVYAQVNRERKRQQQAAQQRPMTQSPLIGNSDSGSNDGFTNSNYHNVLLDPSNNEPIYPSSMPAGDSWV